MFMVHEISDYLFNGLINVYITAEHAVRGSRKTASLTGISHKQNISQVLY